MGQIEHHARWLAGDQRLAKVAHRGAQGRGGALEDVHLEPAFCGGVGVGQAEDAGTDDKDGLSHNDVLKGNLTLLWERACSRLDRCGVTDAPRQLLREQARSHRFIRSVENYCATFSDLPS